jgi:hypothetical protein
MSIDSLKAAALPDYAKDLKLNLGSVLTAGPDRAADLGHRRRLRDRLAQRDRARPILAEAAQHLLTPERSTPPRPPPRSWA